MIRAHKIALEPTSSQALLLSRTCGYARKARNLALADFKAGLDDGAWRSVPELKRRFNAAKDDALPWCRELSQHAAKNAVMDLGKALENWKLDRKKPKKQRRFRFPKFHKRGAWDSYRASNGPDTVPVDDKVVTLSKVGAVRMREALRFAGSVREVTVSREAGRWLELPRFRPPRQHPFCAFKNLDGKPRQRRRPRRHPSPSLSGEKSSFSTVASSSARTLSHCKICLARVLPEAQQTDVAGIGERVAHNGSCGSDGFRAGVFAPQPSHQVVLVVT